MGTAKEAMILTELLSCEQALEIAAQRHGTSYYSKVSAGYAALHKAMTAQIANAAYLPVGDVKKHDPYFWGGVADGIAGPGAGVYMAMSTAQANAEADAENIRRHTANARNLAERPRVAATLSECIASLDSTLDTYDDLRSIRAQWRFYRYANALKELEQWEKKPSSSRKDRKELEELEQTFRGLAVLGIKDALPLIKRTEKCLEKAATQLEKEKKRFKWLVVLEFALLALGIFLISASMGGPASYSWEGSRESFLEAYEAWQPIGTALSTMGVLSMAGGLVVMVYAVIKNAKLQ